MALYHCFRILRSLPIVMMLYTLIHANPTLTPDTWVNVSPAGVPWGSNANTQGMAVDPSNPSTLYLCVASGDGSKTGLWKTTTGGSNWAKIGPFDCPIHIRVDPENSNHLYCGDGVRGGTQGFFVSSDGGQTWTKPQGWIDFGKAIGAFIDDVYDVAPDPTDFNHVLVSFHSAWGWTDTKWNMNAGVLESKDGGTTWIAHEPGSWGYGHSIQFLFNPALGIGNSQTWLFETQGSGFYRTTNSGASWTLITNAGGSTGIVHGGGTIYYSKTGVLYASAYPTNIRSTDNGVNWTSIDPNGNGSTCIIGDGTRLYTGRVFGPAPFRTAFESNDNVWSDFNSQKFTQGPFEMEIDPVNRIVYSASWQAGMWALKLPGTTVNSGVFHSGKSTDRAQADSRLYKTIVNGPHGLFTAPNRAELYDVKGRFAHTVTAPVPQVVIVRTK